MNVMNDATKMAGMLIGEPSFADTMAAIEKADDLSSDKKRHWVTSLRQMARYLDRPTSNQSPVLGTFHLSEARFSPIGLEVLDIAVGTLGGLGLNTAKAAKPPVPPGQEATSTP